MDQPTPAVVKPKVGKNVLGCAAIVIVVLLLILAALLFAVAKSGLLRIPVFSSFYHGPQPTRTVTAAPLTQAQLESDIRSKLAAQIVAGTRPPYRVRITEAELSGALEDALPLALRSAGWKDDRAQIVVTAQHIELLTELERGALHADLLIRLAPRISAVGLGFDPVSIQVGDYSLPPSLAYPLVSNIFSRDLGTWSLNVSSFHLQNIELHEGELDLLVGAG